MQNGAFREADEVKRKFKEKINKEKQEFNIKLHKKEKEHQKVYYGYIKDGEEIVDEVLVSAQKERRHISEQANKLLSVMEDEIPYSTNELLLLLNIKTKETLRSSYLNPALEKGLIKRTLPDKPNSKNQRYIK